ncbi:hypothetical protein FHS78_002807 [Parvibaculum indicum]|uniref:DUF2332 family protein n=1 Tax=Parvibaculum indicum TaxID=562969 RepID=UPI00141E4355|nr:hypothetical protein [Parvibaculum indicum]
MTNSNDIRAAFERQSIACDYLGSPLNARLCRLLGERLDARTNFGNRILAWEGDPQSDALPIRAAGAFHALKRQDRASLAPAYPPNEVTDDELWQALAAAMEREDAFLTAFLDSAPQTNEVSRSNAILGGCLHIAARTGLPLALHEIGSSAGLNLNFDRYHYDLGGREWGDPTSPVKIMSSWEGETPPLDAPLAVASRRGCDLNPLDMSDGAARERLLSYIWPDQTARLARIEAAVDAAARSGTQVEKADAVEWVARHFAKPSKAGHTRVLSHTIVWQYLPAETQARIEAVMKEAALEASEDAPLAWLSMEADETDPSSASLRLRLWPSGEDLELARTDFHGRWTRWT